MPLTFDNRFVCRLPGEPEERNIPHQVQGVFWSPVTPTPVSSPRLIAYSKEVMEALGLSAEEMTASSTVEALSGNGLLDGMFSYSTLYGGHQFGNWAGQLGDGRAINLGETVNSQGERRVLQLKGAGPTPYSRHADGRAVLRSSIREFLCSEAMHHLGVPTTRALSLVLTGDRVMRDMFYDGHPEFEPGAIVCRVSPTFVRFGHFEIFAARRESEQLQTLLDFVVARDFPEIDANDPNKLISFFETVCRATAVMVAHWMRVGFVHGVMNTDNMSIRGLTIDYGPYGWVDDYNPNWTPNTTDLPGRRYCFGQQPQVALWNLLRLANALALLVDDPEQLRAGLDLYAKVYEEESMRMTYQKFGLPGEPESDDPLMARAYRLLEQVETDMTIFFRALDGLQEAKVWEGLAECFYDREQAAGKKEEWEHWGRDYLERVRQTSEKTEERIARMRRANPLYVPRNYIVQEAIELAEKGDYARVHELLDMFRDPYTERPELERFAGRRPDWAREKPGCSMLSCSS